jgi:CHAT domain-containing protein/predicted negative regulator of RcsB-dependent stress response
MLAFVASSFAQAGGAGPVLERAAALIQQGRPELALEELDGVKIASSGPALAVEALLLRADAETARGTYARARAALLSAASLAEGWGDPRARSVVLTELGDLELLLGDPARALQQLDRAVELAVQAGDAGQRARALLNRASARLARQDVDRAAEDLALSLSLARSVEDWSTAARAGINAARALPPSAASEALRALEQAYRLARRIPEAPLRLEPMLSAGVEAQRRAGAPSRSAEGLRSLAFESLSEAARLAAAMNNERSRSAALGHLGTLYEAQGRYEEARRLSQSALFLARTSRDEQLEYLWAWQLGRVHRALGQRDLAIEHYEAAAALLADIKYLLGTGQRGVRDVFSEAVAPVYFGLADLLLGDPEASETVEVRQGRLRRARQTIEKLKAAELEDHFDDGCVTDLQARIKPLEDVDAKTAVLYHIGFSDRMEILVSTGGEMSVVRVAIGAREIGDLVREMRVQLERTSVRAGFLRSATRLYEALVKPVEPLLARRGVETLVFVPYGDFLLIPPAALFDGREFLIQKYAVAVTPGLNLTDPRPLQREGVEILLAGLSEARPGFAALPHVVDEVARIQARFPSRALVDGAFTSQAIEGSLASKPYSILHFATHAQFDPDPAETFLLTYDGRLTIDRLDVLLRQGEFRETPVELLTLSACETAAGDYQAALGLAGVGIKAGARSALASLWPVSDAATLKLIEQFYELLRSQPLLSKAKALQQSQVALISERQFQHPGFWSAFMLIGNWL